MSDDLFHGEADAAPSIIQKFKEKPTLAAAFGGFLATVAFGAYKFKNRDKGHGIALYVVQLRVIAQSVAVGSLTLGMLYSMYDHWILHPRKQKKEL